MPTLDVRLFGERAGRLTEEGGELRFAYDPAWIAAGRPPLSQTLPLDSTPAPEMVRAFIAGLLPEGEPRRLLGRKLHIGERSDFRLLAEIGGDCAGAVSVLPPGAEEPAGEHGSDVRWLNDDELAELIDTLPQRPMLAGEGHIRLSLAGAQDKLPVVVGHDGRVGITAGVTPSTHILKTPITRFTGTVVNEAFCLALGRRLGVDTVEAAPRRASGRECLLVTRYDRTPDGIGVDRLHQEDFCQALGLPPERKYEAMGGPTLADCFALVRDTTSRFGVNVRALLDLVALNFLVGNHDAHAKNLSLLYRPDGRTELAPFYDILCTTAYPGLSRKMAMKIGGEYPPDYVRSRHLDRMLTAAELGPGPALRRLSELTADAPAAARAVRADLAAEGWDDPVLDTVLEIVDRRAAWLTEIAAPRFAAGEARAARG